MRAIKLILSIASLLTASLVAAQTRVTERVSISGQDRLELDFAFADDITIRTWDKDEVLVEVDVTINDGEDDDIFALEKETTGDKVKIEMDNDMWEKAGRSGDNCTWRSELIFTVYLPRSMTLHAKTISGNFILEPYGKPATLKTISGDIDVTVAGSNGLDFRAKTISGEMYSDLEISYPEGKEGLNQIVGMNVKGRINNGGTSMEFETISGNIYLRKG